MISNGVELNLLFIAYTPASLPSLVIPASLVSVLAELRGSIVVDGMLTSNGEESS